MDIQTSFNVDAELNHEAAQSAVEELLSALSNNIDGRDIVIEFLPNGLDDMDIPAARATTVSRLRVEILSGQGPDVFIMRYIKTAGLTGWELDSSEVLFKSPQKVMESGLFLPLDEYIENNARFAEWENFPQAVMDAGHNYEGQQIVPISYTLPVLIYPQNEFDYTPDRLLFWEDMLTDLELAPRMADLINSRDYHTSADEVYTTYMDYLGFTFGKMVDYDKEELLFTEEELLQRVNEILSQNPEDVYTNAEECLLGTKERSDSQPITLLPLYCDDGGVTARIDSYAAVNRNTDFPEDAFAVIDTLMSTEAQQNFKLYSNYFCRNYVSGLPMNEALYVTGTNEKMYSNDENYYEFRELQAQITSAVFEDESFMLLSNLISDCLNAPDQTESLVHKAYEDLQRRVRE